MTSPSTRRLFYPHQPVRFRNTSVATEPELICRDGWLCWIVRPVEEWETDRDGDLIYHVAFTDGHRAHAFADELEVTRTPVPQGFGTTDVRLWHIDRSEYVWRVKNVPAGLLDEYVDAARRLSRRFNDLDMFFRCAHRIDVAVAGEVVHSPVSR